MHADQAVVLDGAGMNDRTVANGDALAHDGRKAPRRVRAVVGDMDDGAVLHIAARADTDEVHVAA